MMKNLKKALKLWASGVTVVTTKSEKLGVQGMTVTSFSSVSLEPHQILVCLNQNTETQAGVFEAQAFAVNVLTINQETVSNQFAGGASQEERFANVSWHEGKTGMPVFDKALVSIECTVAEKILAGTHWVIIGNVEQIKCHSGDPLLYYNSEYSRLA
ncbi:MAG: flavin reductase family protein [Methylococcales bacterium]|nr:flavin reductase family protein [Methylococcales bacterium]